MISKKAGEVSLVNTFTSR